MISLPNFSSLAWINLSASGGKYLIYAILFDGQFYPIENTEDGQNNMNFW